MVKFCPELDQKVHPRKNIEKTLLTNFKDSQTSGCFQKRGGGSEHLQKNCKDKFFLKATGKFKTLKFAYKYSILNVEPGSKF